MEYKIDFKSNKTAAGRGVSSGARRSGDMQEHPHHPEKENPGQGGARPQPVTLGQDVPSPAGTQQKGEAGSGLVYANKTEQSHKTGRARVSRNLRQALDFSKSHYERPWKVSLAAPAGAGLPDLDCTTEPQEVLLKGRL